MRNNLKHFVIGALLAAVPVYYWVNKSLPSAEPETLEIKRVAKGVQVEGYFWSSRLTANPKNEPEVLASATMVSAFTFTNNQIPAQKPTLTPTPTVKPTSAPKLVVKTELKPRIQTAAYIAHNQVGPSEVVGVIERYAAEYGVNKDMMLHIANCESGFRSNAVNGPYAGIYQFVSSTWVSNRRAMGLDPDPNLRYNLEEAVKTAAFKMSRDGFGAWPACQSKARRFISLQTQGIQ